MLRVFGTLDYFGVLENLSMRICIYIRIYILYIYIFLVRERVDESMSMISRYFDYILCFC